MIHNKIEITPLLKKINLTIWPLEDEVKSYILKHFKTGEQLEDLINKTTEEYSNQKEQKIEGNTIIQKMPSVASVAKGIAILSEITMNQIYLFTSERFIIGQIIALHFDISKKFTIYAETENCFIHNMHRKIISDHDLKYRFKAKFLFNHYGDRSILREFISALNNEKEANFDNVVKMEKV